MPSLGLTPTPGSMPLFCAGLPEEGRMVQAALKRGYIPLAFSSWDRDGMQCWDVDWPPETSRDINRVCPARACFGVSLAAADGLPQLMGCLSPV